MLAKDQLNRWGQGMLLMEVMLQRGADTAFYHRFSFTKYI